MMNCVFIAQNKSKSYKHVLMFTFTSYENLEIPVPQASFGMSHDIIYQEAIHKNCDIDIDICYTNPYINYIKQEL